MENTPEYQEWRLKRDAILALEIKVKSFQGSLRHMQENEEPALRKTLAQECAKAGHVYGKEFPDDEWVEKIVYESPSRVYSDGGYDLDEEDVAVDKGHTKRMFRKSCKYCGHAVRREAVVSYK